MRTVFRTLFVILSVVFHASCGPGGSNPEFEQWFNKEFKPMAHRHGISEKTLNRAFKESHRAIDLSTLLTDTPLVDPLQPEQKNLPPQLSEKRMPPRIITARRQAKKHKRILDAVQAKYGVPKEVLLALWGFESNFGNQMGNCVTVHVLANLAFKKPRRDFFTKELIEALKIVQSQNMDPHALKGSKTGALGQCQFMPSTFNAHAVDATKKGYKDIWNSTEDVFESIANYLAKSEWQMGEPWGIEVKLPPYFNKKLATLKIQRSSHYWAKMGVVPKQLGASLPNLIGSLILIKNKAFIVYKNFRVLLKWNRSIPFAVAIGQFADQLRSYDDTDI